MNIALLASTFVLAGGRSDLAPHLAARAGSCDLRRISDPRHAANPAADQDDHMPRAGPHLPARAPWASRLRPLTRRRVGPRR